MTSVDYKAYAKVVDLCKNAQRAAKLFRAICAVLLLWAIGTTWKLTQVSNSNTQYHQDFDGQVRLISQQASYIKDQRATANMPDLSAHLDISPQELLIAPPPIR